MKVFTSVYITNTTNPALRLYPPVALNARAASRDTILPTGGGPNRTSPVFVPKGMLVLYSTYVMHRRKDFYGEDALEFRPERWETQRHGWVSTAMFAKLFFFVFFADVNLMSHRNTCPSTVALASALGSSTP